MLLDLEEREMITIKLAGGKVPFIQFAGLGSLNGVDEIRAEFSAENVKGDRGASTTFTPEQRKPASRSRKKDSYGDAATHGPPPAKPSSTSSQPASPASETSQESTAPNNCATRPGNTPPGKKPLTAMNTSPATWILRSPNSASPTNKPRFQTQLHNIKVIFTLQGDHEHDPRSR